MKKVKLEDICKINMGQSPDSESYNKDKVGIPFFQGNADFGQRYPSVRTWCNSPSKIANTGDILISVRAPIGALNIANCKCCIGRGLAALTADKEKCLPEFLWFALQSKIQELNQKGTGSTFKAISKSTLAETEIFLPTLEEQKKIASVLGKITALISKHQQQLSILDQLVNSQFIEQVEPLIKNASTKPLIELVREDRPITYGILKPGTNVDGGVPVVRVKDYPNGKILQDDMLHTTTQIDSKYTRSHLLPGDLLLSIGGTIGRMAIVPAELEGANITQHTARLSFSEAVLPRYVMGVLEMPMFQHLINGNIKGVAQKGLNLADVKAFQIPVADMDIQKHLVAICEQANQSKSTIQQSLDTLTTLKKSLMQTYFG